MDIDFPETCRNCPEFQSLLLRLLKSRLSLNEEQMSEVESIVAEAREKLNKKATGKTSGLIIPLSIN
jgi:hypothetical protein